MDVLKKVLKALGPILTIALLAFAAYMLIFGGPLFMTAIQGFAGILPEVIVGMEAATWGYIALGAAVVIDLATGGEMIGSIVEGVGKVAGKIIAGAAAGLGVGLFGDGGFGKVAVYAGLGFLLYLFLTREKDESPTPTLETQASKPPDEYQEGLLYGE